MNFNASKCKIMSVCRILKFPSIYVLNGIVLDRVFEFNDLGITVTSDLTWGKHIRSKVAKASQLLGLIKRGLGFTAPALVKKVFYMSLVRSVLTYGSVVWFPNKEEHMLLESVQRRATKFILNDYVSPYTTRLFNLKLLPFSYYKETIDLCFFYKCLQNLLTSVLTPLLAFMKVADLPLAGANRVFCCSTLIIIQSMAVLFILFESHISGIHYLN